jgi:aminomethyltransferase
VAWLQAQAAMFSGDLKLTDASHNYSALAVQGPRVKDFINAVVPGPSLSAKRVNSVTNLKKNEIGGFSFEHGGILVSRTGYTGEDGFEIVGGDEAIQHAWNKILDTGAPFGIKPCGLGARDTLRTEVCFPLYGHELDEATTPIEAGLGRFVSFDKGDFIGGPALTVQNADGVHKKLIAFKMVGASAPPRPEYPIFWGNLKIGAVTSGTPSPSLGIGIGMGYVLPEFAMPSQSIEIEIRGRLTLATVAPKPIYKAGKS